MRNAAVFQTMDCARTREMSDGLSEHVEGLREQKAAFSSEMQRLRQDEEAEQRTIKELEQ